jgi:hypothetical protein
MDANLTKDQQSNLRIADLVRALYKLPEFKACTEHERLIALSQWITSELQKTRR